jgi:hypothetical protein
MSAEKASPQGEADIKNEMMPVRKERFSTMRSVKKFIESKSRPHT